MQTSPSAVQLQIEQRLRVMRTLWGGLLGSVGVYYVITLFVEQPADNSSPKFDVFWSSINHVNPVK